MVSSRGMMRVLNYQIHETSRIFFAMKGCRDAECIVVELLMTSFSSMFPAQFSILSSLLRQNQI